MPHPLDVADVLKGIEGLSDLTIEATATQSLTASNPVRRALLMDPAADLIAAAEQIREVLETATAPSFPKGLKFDFYPLAMMLGTTPIGKVKARRGEQFSFGAPVLIGEQGGWVDPFELAEEGIPDGAIDAIDDTTEEQSMYEIGTHPECEGVAIVTVEGDLVDCFADEAEAQAALDALMAEAESSAVSDSADMPFEATGKRTALGASTVHADDEILADLDDLSLDETAPWEGLIAVEGVETGDGRFLMEEALSWRNLPLPLMLMTENPVGGDGHDGARLAGRSDKVWRDGTEVYGSGVLDLGSDAGREAHRLLGKQMLRGVSADIDRVQWDVEADGDPLAEALGMSQSNRVAQGRIMGATLCVFPALEECSVWLVDGAGTMHESPEALAASAAPRYGRVVWYTPLDKIGEPIVAAAGGNYPV